MRVAPTTILALVALGTLLGMFGGAALALDSVGVWLAMASLGAAGLTLGASTVGSAAALSIPYSVVLVAAACAAGVALSPRAHDAGTLPPAGMVRLRAVVHDVRYGQADEARSRVVVLTGQRVADGAAISPGTELWVHPRALPEGATVQLLGELSPTAPLRNPTPHPALPSARSVRGHLTLPGPDAVQVISHAAWARWLYQLRTHVRSQLVRTLDGDAASVARALVLGDPDTLGEDDDASLRTSGMAHVFAVSGMHVTLLAGMAMLVIAALLLRTPLGARCDARRIAAGVGVPMALFIGAFTGAVPSGVRAAVTTALAWTLVACGRKPHAGAITAAACLLLIVAEPEHALRPAFLLSIAATAAIVAAPAPHPSSLSALIATAATLSVRTSLATAPIVLWSFGTLPLLGVLANLLLLPLGSALLVLCAGHALLAALSPVLGALTAWLVATCSRAFLAACDALADQTPDIPWPLLDIPQGIVVTATAALLLLATRMRTRVIAGGVALVLLGLLEVRLRWVEQPRGELRVTFLDVGQGDAALVDLPDGKLMLIDAGGNPQGGADPGERAVVPLLRARRRDQIDIAVLSHPHPDHYGGLSAVFDAVSIGELWDTGQAQAEAELEASAASAAQLVRRARERGTRVLDPTTLCAAPRLVGDAVIEVLWPCPRYDPDHDPNDNSLVLRIRYGAHSFLFTGDIEAHAEQALTRSRVPLRADVLKVPHHGSRTSSSDALLRAVAPTLAIISAGAVNRFGHPHGEVVQRLRAHVPRVIDLGRSGGTIVRTDGRSLSLQTWSGQRWPNTSTRAPSEDTSTSAVSGVAQNK